MQQGQSRVLVEVLDEFRHVILEDHADLALLEGREE